MAILNNKNLPTASTGTKKNNTNGLTTPVAALPNTSYSANMAISTVGGLTPTANTLLTQPVNTSLNYSSNIGNLVGVQPVNGVGGSVGGVTDEGVVIGGGQKVNNTTFNSISGTSGGEKSEVDTSYGANAPLIVPVQVQPVATTSTINTLSYSANSNNATESANQAGSNSTSAAAGTEGDSTAPVMTYEQWAAEEEKRITDTRDSAYTAIENNKNNVIAQAGIDRDTAVQTAETNRERAIVDARSSYEQNKATYGANAEALASMGLSGSGYGDYINSQAYVAQRGETQAANAQAQNAKANAETTYDKAVLDAEQTANASKLEADTSYAANMSALGEKNIAHQEALDEKAKQDEETKKNTYAALLTSANNGEYDAEQLAALGAQYGLDETQISSLQAAANDYATKETEERHNQGYSDAITYLSQNGSAASPEYFDTLLAKDLISEDDYEDIMEMYEKVVKEEQGDAGVDTEKIDEKLDSGKITQEEYDKQKKDWNDSIDTSTSAFSSGTMSKGEATQYLNDIIGNSWCSEETKKALQARYDYYYSAKTSDVKFNNNGGWWIFGSTDFSDGDNFSVVDDSGFKYRIQSGGVITDSAIHEAADGISEGVFAARGQIYYKKSGKIYLIEKRDNSYGDHYDKLYKKFYS